MSLFGSLMGDVEDDPFFGSHMRHMRQMNNMMNSLFADPFGMAGPLALMPRHGGMAGMGGMAAMGGMAGMGGMGMMPFMPQMPQMSRLFSGDLEHMGAPGSSFSSSTVVMSSNGPHGKPQVYSSSSSTKIGPDGIKETRKTLQDTRTGTKKMSIGHHIGERAHVVEREHNLYSGDAEERQEFINLDEEEAEDFDREFQVKAGGYTAARALAPRPRLALEPPPAHHAPPAIHAPAAHHVPSRSSDRRAVRPAPRRPLRATPGELPSASVREVYGGAAPLRARHRPARRAAPGDAAPAPPAPHAPPAPPAHSAPPAPQH